MPSANRREPAAAGRGAAVATAAEVDVGTLAERLRAAAVSGDHCILMPRLVGAWARVGG